MMLVIKIKTTKPGNSCVAKGIRCEEARIVSQMRLTPAVAKLNIIIMNTLIPQPSLPIDSLSAHSKSPAKSMWLNSK